VQRIVQKIRGRQKSSVALFILRVNQNHRRRLHHSSTKPEENFFSGANLIFQKQKNLIRAKRKVSRKFTKRTTNSKFLCRSTNYSSFALHVFAAFGTSFKAEPDFIKKTFSHFLDRLMGFAR